MINSRGYPYRDLKQRDWESAEYHPLGNQSKVIGYADCPDKH